MVHDHCYISFVVVDVVPYQREQYAIAIECFIVLVLHMKVPKKENESLVASIVMS